MTTETNRMGVPEISCYSRQEIDGGVIIRYLVRKPSKRAWTSATLFVPAEDRRRAASSSTIPRKTTPVRERYPDRCRLSECCASRPRASCAGSPYGQFTSFTCLMGNAEAKQPLMAIA
jgi:hypothetical protein